MPSTDLVTVEFAEQINGSELDEERAAVLIAVASDMVREHCRASWDEDTVPVRVKVAVAYMVIDALAEVPTDTGQVKAEQIGDYRVEYARPAIAALTLEPHLSVLNDYRTTAYAVRTLPAFDGVDEDESEDES